MIQLTSREKEVLALLEENASNKDIAKGLNMSVRTAKFHVSNLLAKYGVERRGDLIIRAKRRTFWRHLFRWARQLVGL